MTSLLFAGVIDGKVTFVPLYVDVDLRVAQGIKNATDAQWKELVDMYDRAVAHIDFKKTKGNTCKRNDRLFSYF